MQRLVKYHFSSVSFFIKVCCLCCLFFLVTLYSCKKMIEVDPPIDSIIGNEVYNTDLGAASVLTGIYSDMSNIGFANGIKSVDVRTGLYTDELNLYSANSNVFLASLFNNS